MVGKPDTQVPPGRGTIASRYLEAISCGNDVSALSMSSSTFRPPSKPNQKTQQRRVGDASCSGITASTAAMDTSASWTTMETRSRSDATSRAGSRAGSLRRIRNAAASLPMNRNKVHLGVEDDCSSIESSSSHRRTAPAHMSLEIEDNFLEKTFACSTPNSSFNNVSASFLFQKARKRRASKQGHTPRNNLNTSVDSNRGNNSLFPKTSPKKPTAHRNAANKGAVLSSPYRMRRSARTLPKSPNQSLESEENINLLQTDRDMVESTGAAEECAVSEAGAATEVMTNRTQDILSRYPVPAPIQPPSLRRRQWPPPESSKKKPPMKSLMDETSTFEDSTTASLDRKHPHSLMDSFSSSLSLPNSPVNAPMERMLSFQTQDSSGGVLEDGGVPQTGYDHAQVNVTVVSQPQEENAAHREPQRLDDADTPAPARFFMATEFDPAKELNQPSSVELTSSGSTMDGLLSPDRRAEQVSKFVRYNERKQPNAHEVFQRRAPSDGSSYSSYSSSEKERDTERNKTATPIQPLFSLDRVDFSYDANSPIRKWRSRSIGRDEKKQNRGVPTRSKSLSEPLERKILRRQHERQQRAERVQKASPGQSVEKQQQNEPDPIFCPGSTSFSTNGDGTPNPIRGFSHESGPVGGGHIPAESKPAARPVLMNQDSSGTGIDPELVYIMNSRRQEIEVAPPIDNTRDETSSADEILQDLRLHDIHRRVGDHVRSATAKPSKKPRENSSLQAHTNQQASVQNAVRALNWRAPENQPTTQPRTGYTPSSTHPSQTLINRQELVSGAHLAHAFNSEEKKEEASIDLSAMESLPWPNIERDDDDTASVRSLRDMFEGIFHRERTREFPDDEEEDDDTASVRSLREKLERRIDSHGVQNPQGEEDDEGSVKSLRERFEGPPKRNVGKVSHLRAMFESKLPPAKGNPRPVDQKNVAVLQPEDEAHEVQHTPEMGSKHNSVSQAPVDIKPVPAEAELVLSVEDSRRRLEQTVTRPPSQHSTKARPDPQVSASSSNPTASRGNASSPYQPNGTSRAETPVRKVNRVRSEESGTDQPSLTVTASEDHSSQSSRVRGPAHSPFLSMRDRLMHFSKQHQTQSQGASNKKNAPPTMQERLNRWARRHQATKSKPLAAQVDGGEIENVGIQQSMSYDLSSVAPSEEDEDVVVTMPKFMIAAAKVPDSESPKQADGFFSRTKPHRRENGRQKTTAPQETHAHKQGHSGLQGNRVDARVEENNSYFPVSQQGASGSGVIMKGLKREATFPGRGDVKGRSTDTDNTEGVTLDASIGEVSALTNPAFILSKGSKEAQRKHSPPAQIPEVPSESPTNLPSVELEPRTTREVQLSASEPKRYNQDRASGAEIEVEVGMTTELNERTMSKQTPDAHSAQVHSDLHIGLEWQGNAGKQALHHPSDAEVVREPESSERVLNSQVHESTLGDNDNGWDLGASEPSSALQPQVPMDKFSHRETLEPAQYASVDWPAFDEDDRHWENPTPSQTSSNGATPMQVESSARVNPQGRQFAKETTQQSQGLSVVQRENGRYLNQSTGASPAGSEWAKHPERPGEVQGRSPHEVERIETYVERPSVHANTAFAANMQEPHFDLRRAQQAAASRSHVSAAHAASVHPSQADGQHHAPPSEPALNQSSNGVQLNQQAGHTRHAPGHEDRYASNHQASQLESLRRRHASGKVSDTSSLPPLPAPSDADYETVMESRHQMLLNRQRALQRRKAERERNSNNQHRTGVDNTHLGTSHSTAQGFFGRTHPGSIHASQPAPREQVARPARQPQDDRDMHSSQVDVPGREEQSGAFVGEPTNSKGSGEINNYRARSARAEQTGAVPRPSRPVEKPQPKSTPPSTTIYGRFTERLGLAGNTKASRHDALVARLKAVKAARMKRAGLARPK